MNTTWKTHNRIFFAVPEYHLVQASGGKRFANYIIDILFLYALVILAAIVMAILTL